ncbi:hypothetical protein VPH35_124624 [Triticum aestivum]
MDNSQQQYLYYCMWRQRTLLVLFVMLVLWWSKKKERKNRAKRVKYGPLVKRDIWRSTELIRLIDTSERTCLRQLRMYPAVFYKLCAHLRDKKLLADTIHVSVEEQLAMFLKIVGQYHTHSSVGFALWRSEETVSRMGEQKEGAKREVARSRDNYMSWSDDCTKYMLEWYIEKQRDKPPTFKWKAQHHLQCANDLNDKFGITATAKQVDRHFRSFKEKWKWIKLAKGRSGYGFDKVLNKFNIDKSEKSPSKLGKIKFNYLTHSIKFYHLLEELFSDSSHADGSLAIDVNNASENVESDGSSETSSHTSTAEQGLSDSDMIAPNSPAEGTSSNLKRKHVKAPHKKKPKVKARRARVLDDDVAASIVSLAETVKSAAPIQPIAATDPNANLWKHIESLTLPANEKIELATYLAKPEQEVFRGFLNCASDQTFNAWVLDYFAHKYDGKDRATADPSI